MIKSYSIYDAKHNYIASFDELIECNKVCDTSSVYLYALIGFPLAKVKSFNSNEFYQLKTKLYSERLDFEFSVIEINVINQVVYLKTINSGGMYLFGALTIINAHRKVNYRIFTDLQKASKMAYLSASYLISGFGTQLKKNEIVLDGNYIVDAYSFFCELGYGFFGMFGYMGWNLAAVSDMLSDLYDKDNMIKILWVNYEQSKLMIVNSIPDLYNNKNYDFIENAVETLMEYTVLELR